jgi:hypothetical protein
MTTNDLIDLIRENHMNGDCLAQIAMAVEAMREELALDERERERCDDRCDGCERGCDACNDGHTGDGEPSDDGADAEWLASAGWGTDEDYE